MSEFKLMVGRYPATKSQVEVAERHDDEGHAIFKRLVWLGLEARAAAQIDLPLENEEGQRVVHGARRRMNDIADIYLAAAQSLGLPLGNREINRWDEYLPYMVLRRRGGDLDRWMQRLIDRNGGIVPETWSYSDTRENDS